MSVTQDVDLIINVAGLVALLWLSVATVLRWIQRGRVESYSVDALLPKRLPSCVRWLLAPTFVIVPVPSESDRRPAWGVTPWGWLCLSCIAVWLLVKAI